jgi:pyruvate/2-oxoglutarate dehydrogenase complex dihydrolipoamide dehydrogenase (E3) component
MEHYDLAVIGFGKAGKTLAGFYAGQGKKTAVIERDKKMYGGTCINVACIPTKALVFQAERAYLAGDSYKARNAYYQASMQFKDNLTGKLRDKNYHKLADSPLIKVYDGVGSFLDKNTLLISAEGREERISADKILIDTGSRPLVPPIEGLKESKRAMVSEQMLEIRELPHHLLIIGGGYIGLEFASMYAAFGSKVTIIQDGMDFIPREDEDIAKAVYDSLTARGIEIIKGAKIYLVRDYKKESKVFYEQEGVKKNVSGDRILVAVGRRPNVSDLHLEKAGVLLTDRGAIQTDEHLVTSQSNIYAAGDAVGGLQFTYISLDDYRILASELAGDSSRTTLNRGNVPYSVFISPCFSRVGLSEKEALAKGFKIKVGKIPAAVIPKAGILHDTTGLLKVIINAEDQTILGAHLFCEESYEIINLLKLAMDLKVPYTRLRDDIYTHPTMSEGLNDLFASVK